VRKEIDKFEEAETAGEVPSSGTEVAADLPAGKAGVQSDVEHKAEISGEAPLTSGEHKKDYDR